MRITTLHQSPRTRWSRRAWMVAVAGVVTTACSDGPLALDEELDASFGRGFNRAGAVYLMSNDAAANEIIIFDRAASGELTAAARIATGGLGTSAGLGNQGSLILSRDHRRLYAVNAGSNDISVFRVKHEGIELIGSPVPSGGEQPISLTVHGNLLYVLNAGGAGNIAGFRIGRHDELTPLPGSIQPLSSDAAGPAQIQFNPNGRVLVVTEKATNTISTYMVGQGGVAMGPKVHASAGETPFGFNFNGRGVLVVSEAFGGADGASTASSYAVDRRGNLALVSGTVATTQTAACWIAISENGRYAYTTNTGSGTVSSLAIGPRGSLSLLDGDAGVTGEGSLPQDADLTPGGRFMYVRNGGGSVSAFRIESGGGLTHIADFGPLPESANGIAAR